MARNHAEAREAEEEAAVEHRVAAREVATGAEHWVAGRVAGGLVVQEGRMEGAKADGVVKEAEMVAEEAVHRRLRERVERCRRGWCGWLFRRR